MKSYTTGSTGMRGFKIPDEQINQFSMHLAENYLSRGLTSPELNKRITDAKYQQIGLTRVTPEGKKTNTDLKMTPFQTDKSIIEFEESESKNQNNAGNETFVYDERDFVISTHEANARIKSD